MSTWSGAMPPASRDESFRHGRLFMASSAAKTVDQYLKELPPERREVISAVREVIRENLPTGYEEAMSFGMISYQIPLERYPDTYNGQPLMYAALAAQKNYYAVYLMGLYREDAPPGWFAEEFRKAGKKLDMGKSCVRFKRVEDLPLEVIGKAVREVGVEEYIRAVEAARQK